MPILSDRNNQQTEFFDAPTNPMRAMNEKWQEAVEKTPPLRFVGYVWDAILVVLYVLSGRAVLADGLGLGHTVEPVFFTVAGFVLVALVLIFFFRPVGRAAVLQAVRLVRFIRKTLFALLGGPPQAKE